jgi:hypothetical protein
VSCDERDATNWVTNVNRTSMNSWETSSQLNRFDSIA